MSWGDLLNRVSAYERHIESLPEEELIAKAAVLGVRFEEYTNESGEVFIEPYINGIKEGGWRTPRRAAIAALLIMDQLEWDT